MMLSESFSMTQNGARRTLRRLELEAYASVISAFRAQGQFTKDKKASLEVLCKSLGISADRHRAEIRRAVNDELLSLVAIRVSGVDTDRAWRREGQKLCPSHSRFVTHPTAPHAPQVLVASAGAASLSTAVNNLSHAPDRMPLPIQKALRTIMAQNPNKSLHQFPAPSPTPGTRPTVNPKSELVGAGEGPGAKAGGSGKAYSQLESLLCEENLMQQGDSEEDRKEEVGQTEKPKTARQQESRKDVVPVSKGLPRPSPGESPAKREDVSSAVKGQRAGVSQRVATSQGEAKKRSLASSEEPSPAVKKLALDSQGLPRPVTPPRSSPQKLLTLSPKTTPPRQSKLLPKPQPNSPKQPASLKQPIPSKQPISPKQPIPPKQPISPKQPVLAARVLAGKAITGLPKSTSSVTISPLTTVVPSPSTPDPRPPHPVTTTNTSSLTTVSTHSETVSSTTTRPSSSLATVSTHSGTATPQPPSQLSTVSAASAGSVTTSPLKPPPPLATPTESPLPPTAPPPEELVPEGAESLIQDLIQDTSDTAVFSLASQLGLGSADSALLNLSDFINIIQPDASDISSPSTPLTLVPPPAPPPFTSTSGRSQPPPLALGHCIADPPALIDMSATLTSEDTPPQQSLGGGEREETSSETFIQSSPASRPDSLQLPQTRVPVASSGGVLTTPAVAPQATPIDAVLSISTPTEPVLPLATPTCIATPTEADKGESGLPSDYLDLSDIGSLMGGSGDGSELLQGMPEDVAKSIQTLVQLDQQTWN